MRVAVDEALHAVRSAIARPRAVSVRLSDAKNRVLFEPVMASRDQPPFDAAAMDGYAVAAGFLPSNIYSVVGESIAGRTFDGALTNLDAVRIFTGAPLPPGTNRVILQEDISRVGNTIQLKKGAALSNKNHVRPRGSDFRQNDILLSPGDRLDGWKLALAAASGTAHVTVFDRPKVLIVCTGDELVSPGGKPRDDQIFESNSFALSALIELWGGEVVTADVSLDDLDDLAKTLEDLDADIVLTVGGASVGDYDLVRPALTEASVLWDFQAVNMKPGKPTAFGMLPDGRPVLCLPGNPGSALISAHLFLKPLVKKMLGQTTEKPFQDLACATGLPANGARETYIRSIVLSGMNGGLTILPFSCQDSGNMRDFAITNGVVRRVPNAPAIIAGEICECFLLRDT